MSVIIKFAPLVIPLIPPVAPDESLTLQQNSGLTPITPVITVNGTVVTPDSLSIVDEPSNGSASTAGAALWYSPNDGYTGFDSFTYQATVSGVDSNVADVGITVLGAPCGELGRVTRSFVSAYTASRAETRRVRRFSQRCVTANFNGALEAGRTIVHVRWDTTSPWSILMANPRIIMGQRQVAVDVSFNFAGGGGLLATVTLENGEMYNQEFFYTVLDRPIYPGAVYDSSTGPYVLTADA
jgi:hypothetical protein